MPVRLLALASLQAMMFVALPLSAHHSDAGIDMESIVAFEGVVTDFVWRNPHVYVLVDRVGEDGEAVEWELQMGPTNVMSRRGWRRDTLQSGDRVSVRAHASMSGRTYGIVDSIDRDGGLRLEAVAGEAPAPETTATLEGRWIADRSATMSYPGGFDGFFNALLTLNENGRSAQAAYDPLSDENPEATCVGRPTPAALVSTSLYLMEIDIREEEQTVLLRSEWYDEVRTVHMDGREHPDPGERFVTGHSIGWWEEDTLVVDTRNFEDHRSPYQIGVPSGGQKHVVERYTLNEHGAHIDLEFVLEDPEYLAEPMVHRRQLNYSPHLQMYPGECDPVATSRFVEQ
ncbi:MAG: DUF6152 family protein [Rhodospirillaceae bacterium]|nr:DUF6152 family protein [Rhodospirillaceae bacterium]